MTLKTVSSSKKNPCPVCDRTKDGDCRILESGNVILCHTHPADPGDALNGYRFLHPSKDQLWGVFVWGESKGKKEAKQRPARERYIYTDREGRNLVMAVRLTREGGKSFAQYHWDGVEWKKGLNDYQKVHVPIYRYQEVKQAIAQGKTIFMVEGEAKCDKLWDLGIPATTTLGGSKKYRAYGKYFDDLANATLVLCPDRDKLGLEHMEDIALDFPQAKWCYVYPDSPVWRNLPKDGGLDVEDWIADGATPESIAKAITDKRSESGAKAEASELDTLEGRKAKYMRILTEWHRIDAIEDFGLQYTERYLLSQREKIPLREITEIGKRARSNDPLNTISVKALCDQPDTTQGDLIESVLEIGSSLLLFAQSKAGKTPLAYDLAYSVATGDRWMGEFEVPEPGGVLILQSDETERASKKNFRRRGLHHLENVEFCKEFTIDDLPRLCRKVTELQKTTGLKLVIVDSLTTINAQSSFGENDAEFARDLYRLARAITDLGVTLIVTHHRRKGGLIGDLDGASGSGRIVAAVDDVWALHRMDPKEDQTKLKRILERVAAHDGELFRWVIKLDLTDRSWGLEGEYDADAEIGDRLLDFCPPEKIDKSIDQRIVEFLEGSDQRWEISDLAQTLNINENTARKVLPKLSDKGVIDRVKADYRSGSKYPQLYFGKRNRPEKGETIHPRNDPPNDGIVSQSHTESQFRETILNGSFLQKNSGAVKELW